MWWPPRGLRNLQRRFSSVFVCLRPKTINHQSIGEQEAKKNETKIAKGSEGLQISLAIIARDFSIGRSFPEELRRRRYDLSARATTTTAQVRLVGFLSLFFFFFALAIKKDDSLLVRKKLPSKSFERASLFCYTFMKRLTQLVAMGFNEMRLLCGNATDRLVLYGPLLDSLGAPDRRRSRRSIKNVLINFDFELIELLWLRSFFSRKL